MKNIIFFIIIITITSCSCFKKQEMEIKQKIQNQKETPKENMQIIEKFVILPNSKIVYKKDEFGIGYVNIAEGNKNVFRYTYKLKPNDPNIQDGNYTQEIFFEIQGKIKENEYKDNDLKKINALIGVHGFFRKAGIFPITKGKVSINPSKNTINLQIHIIKPDYMVKKKEISQTLEL